MKTRTVTAGITAAVLALATQIPAASSAPSELEGVRDCGDVTSTHWVHYIETIDDIDEYRGQSWVVFGGEGLAPACRFARKWSKKLVKHADRPARKKYRVVLKKGPGGWRCVVRNQPEPVLSTGGLLQCLKFRRAAGKRTVVGAFSSTPDFATQEGPI